MELDHRTAGTGGRVAWVFPAVEATRDADGQVIGLSGVCQDVTARKEAEAAARSALARERVAIEDLRRLDTVKQAVDQTPAAGAALPGVREGGTGG